MKAELKNLEICKTSMKWSNVMFIYLTMNLIIWTIVVRMSMPLSTEFTWSFKDTPHTCASLKSVHRNRQDEMKFTFDVEKCDKIFDELLSIGKIKLSHAIPLIDDLKKHAYCKWHNSYSHATNDCNVFQRQIQLVINGGQLCLKQTHVDKDPFLVNVIDLQGAKVLAWLE
jgi:polyhydroxyalkanoate synthesis regulator phasin